ncbi:cobalamin biosynthesis protein CobG [Streptomyces sp. NPDC017940]|uniref:cobalamin biosynthesis protein CobG n=1 Tax=Streptomyces sp. NPDC017940 TaxID=3365017 RepID=UPI00378EFD2E
MLAAVTTAPPPSSSQATAAARDRGDACPGALRLHGAHDGALARVRVPGGVLTVRQAEALLGAAEELGDGELHLTSRGNVQLRGLRDACGAELAGRLGAAGLLPSAAHERVRNIVASPLSGLDGHGLRDVRPWLVSLDATLCASEAAPALSGRFLFALDDGRGDVAALDADVTLRAAADGGALLGLGSGDATLHVSGPDAPRAALLAAEVFLATVRSCGTEAWRVDELALADGALLRRVGDRLLAEGIAHTGCAGGSGAAGACGDAVSGDASVPGGASVLGGGAVPGGGLVSGSASVPGGDPVPDSGPVPGDGPVPDSASPPDGSPVPDSASPPDGGPVPGVVGDFAALSVHAPLGRLSASQWRELARVAALSPAGELRLTPWRGVVVPTPGLGADRVEEARAGLSAVGLVTENGSPWLLVGACIGRPGCAKSRTDVRADAARTLAEVPSDSLPLYWSGCERRCGHPRGDHIDVVAADGGGGYRLSVATTAATAATATAPAGDPTPRTVDLDDPSRLATALAAIPSRRPRAARRTP